MSKFVAVCDNLNETLWAAGDTEEGAKALLWKRAHEYLVKRQAPETSDYSAEELEDYFGVRVIDISEGWGYL